MDVDIDTVLGTLVPGAPGQRWHVFRTRPRCEKKAAEEFEDLRLAHYLPLKQQVYRRKGRRYESSLPLFPGYVFGCCDTGERLRAMQLAPLTQWIDVADQTTLLAELHDIVIATLRGTGVQLYPRLTRGQRVKVVRGPLAGLRGRISRRKENYRIVLEMTAMQAAVGVEVEMQDVEIDDSAEPGLFEEAAG